MNHRFQQQDQDERQPTIWSTIVIPVVVALITSVMTRRFGLPGVLGAIGLIALGFLLADVIRRARQGEQ